MKKYLLCFVVLSFLIISCDTIDDEIDRTPSFEVLWDTDSLLFDNFGAVHNLNGSFTVSGFTYKEEVNEGEGVDHHYRTRNIVVENISFVKGQYSFFEQEAFLTITDRYFLDDEMYKVDFTIPDMDSIIELGSYFYIDDIVTGHNFVSGFFEIGFWNGDTIPTEIEGTFRNIHYSEP